MKNNKIIISLVLSMVLSGFVYGEGYLSLSANALFSSDSGYKDVYGSTIIYPEIEAGYKTYKDMFIFGGFGFFSKEGKTTGELQINTKSTQNILSFGVGYDFNLNEKIDILIRAGIARIGYKEEAMEQEVKGNKIGILLGSDLVYKFGKRFFTKATIGYMSAKDTIEGVDIKLGGFKVGIGVGLRF